MTITSFGYLVFIAIGVLIYYILPKSLQWVELLLVSITFYCLVATPYTLAYVIISAIVVWGGTNLVEKIRQRGMEASRPHLLRNIVALVIGVNILMWFLVKGTELWKSILNFMGIHFSVAASLQTTELLAVLGMGYYTVQLIGYVLDCYWEITKPQKNVLKVFLFTAFFPQMITGPISRYEQLKGIYEKHKFSYLNITYGIQRILWGFFKKIVLAERVGIIVNCIWSNADAYPGLYAWMSLLLYPIQLYADFSGCMDIVIGTAEMFDIKLPENFKNPFFSQTSQEFWQRWHITLGAWAKDYVMYPVLKSKLFVTFGKYTKQKFGKKVGRILPTAMGMLVLWVVLGIWHGGYKYIIAFNLGYWLLLVLGELMAPIGARMIHILNICTENFSWKLFRMARTYFIFAFACVFFRAASITQGLVFLKRLNHNWNPWIFFDGSLLNLGITYMDLNVLVFSLVLLLIVAVLREKYGYARTWMAQQSFLFRWVVWIGLFMFVLIFGMYGPGYNSADFIYQGF